jgi:hypothetical protein
VEHVHVHSGAQAVVGVVGTSGPRIMPKSMVKPMPRKRKISYARQPEMRCPQPQDRAAVPTGSNAEWPLPHARRTVVGGAEG